jgi:hypothetical protein
MVNRDPEEPLLSEEEGRQNNVPPKSGFYTIFKNFVLMGWVGKSTRSF